VKSNIIKACTIVTALFILSFTLFEHNADARAGGGRSYGGSRSYSRPAAPSYQPRQQVAPPTGTIPQQQSGGFMRSMAGGMLGGMLGNMLFSGSAGAGAGAGTGAGADGMSDGGGMGLFGIMLLAGAGYLAYRYIKKKRADTAAGLR
jgi:hypothetical protein